MDELIQSSLPQAEPRRSRWLPWLLGAALLVGLLTVALNLSSAADFLRLAESVAPAWLAVAVATQLGTYVAEGAGWAIVARAGGHPIRLWLSTRMSVVKLFVDQALPSAGLSGTAAFGMALQARGVPSPLVLVAVAVDIATYYIAYVIALAIALAIAVDQGLASAFVLAVAALFAAIAIAIAVAVLALTGRRVRVLAAIASRFKPIRKAVELIEGADPKLARSPTILAKATGCQLGVFVLDAATLWLAVRSLGVAAPIGAVFASFMLANLFRTLSIVPAGLGTFDAMAVAMLSASGLTVPVALSATLLFRGLSFFLPLVPGALLAQLSRRRHRRANKQAAQGEAQVTDARGPSKNN